MWLIQDLRRKRNDVTVELRKASRDEQLTKHRNIVLDDHEEINVEQNFDYEMTVDNIKEGKITNFYCGKTAFFYSILVYYL